ncbi:MAG TPA: response regulator, partial [Candidatus Blautia faecavium]|nr:response regulator [Candidatus Blautia faecavium]
MKAMKSILIVEDDKKLNEGIRLALRKEFLCIQAFSVREAWEAYKKQKFALILLDVNLPDGSGIEFMTEL